MPLEALTFDQCQNSPQTPPRVLTMLFGRGCAGQFPSVVANNFVILKADRKLTRQIQGKNRWILWVALPEIIDSKETNPRAFQKKRLHCEGRVREQSQQESNFLIGRVDRGKCLCATVGNTHVIANTEHKHIHEHKMIKSAQTQTRTNTNTVANNFKKTYFCSDYPSAGRKFPSELGRFQNIPPGIIKVPG